MEPTSQNTSQLSQSSSGSHLTQQAQSCDQVSSGHITDDDKHSQSNKSLKSNSSPLNGHEIITENVDKSDGSKGRNCDEKEGENQPLKTILSDQTSKHEEMKLKPKTDSNSDDNQSSQLQQKKEEVKEKSKGDGTTSDSDDEQEDQDEEELLANSSQSTIMEISPKGRFNRFNEELGRGAYKIVYRGADTETGREIAWNVVNLRRLSRQDRMRIKSEIDLIKKLQHQHIIHFISAWINKQKEQVIFITELINGGTLRKYVKKIKNIKLKVIKKWCTEILQGLIYLHEQKPHAIIHRDLKCDNIFINANTGDIRIGDLGLSTPMQNSYSTSVLGTPEFMAPELYEECYGTGVDIYAFGMCVLEMITLERPYKECANPAQIYSKVIQGIRPQALDRIEDEEIKEFIMSCLTPVSARPSARKLLESKFLHDLESESNMQVVRVKPSVKKHNQRRDSLMKAGETIMEEEEEDNNSDGEESKTKKVEENNEKFEKTEIKESSSETSSSSEEEEKLSSKVEEESKNEDGDDEDGSNKDEDHFNKREEQIRRELYKKKLIKKRKKNQKLDESFTFLQQMKRKNKKLKREAEQNQINNQDSQDDADSEDEDEDNKKKQNIQNNALKIDKKKNFKEDDISPATSKANMSQGKSPVLPKGAIESHSELKRIASKDQVNTTPQSKILHQIETQTLKKGATLNNILPKTDQPSTQIQKQNTPQSQQLLAQQQQQLLPQQQNKKQTFSSSQPQYNDSAQSHYKNSDDQDERELEMDRLMLDANSITSRHHDEQRSSQYSKQSEQNYPSQQRSSQFSKGQPSPNSIPNQNQQRQHQVPIVGQSPIGTGVNTHLKVQQSKPEEYHDPNLRNQQAQQMVQKQNPPTTNAQATKQNQQYPQSLQVKQRTSEEHSHLHPKPINLGRIPMKFKIKSKDGSEKEVTFEFDTNGDTPVGVAQEMVKELGLSTNYIDQIAGHISHEVKEQMQIQQQKSQQKQQQSSLQQQMSGHNLQQQAIKKSPDKISKDNAYNQMRTLVEQIDGFYTGLQAKNLDFGEFIEALELTEEEKALKVEFLQNLSHIRNNYRNKYDEYKKKMAQKKKMPQEVQGNLQLSQMQGQTTVPVKQQQKISPQQEQNQQYHQQKGQSQVTSGQQSKKNGGQSHQTFATESMKQQSFKLKREGSNNDFQSNQYQDHEHQQQIEQHSSKSRQYQEHSNQQLGKSFNFSQHANIHLQVPQLLHSSMYKGNTEMLEGDVQILQNTLNVIYHASIQNKDQDHGTYYYLKVDGVFGEKTKNFIMKFQESANLQVDGVVTEHLWKKLVHTYEKIQKEDLNKRKEKMHQQLTQKPKDKQIVINQPQQYYQQQQQHYQQPQYKQGMNGQMPFAQAQQSKTSPQKYTSQGSSQKIMSRYSKDVGELIYDDDDDDNIELCIEEPSNRNDILYFSGQDLIQQQQNYDQSDQQSN